MQSVDTVRVRGFTLERLRLSNKQIKKYPRRADGQKINVRQQVQNSMNSPLEFEDETPKASRYHLKFPALVKSERKLVDMQS